MSTERDRVQRETFISRVPAREKLEVLLLVLTFTARRLLRGAILFLLAEPVCATIPFLGELAKAALRVNH